MDVHAPTTIQMVVLVRGGGETKTWDGGRRRRQQKRYVAAMTMNVCCFFPPFAADLSILVTVFQQMENENFWGSGRGIACFRLTLESSRVCKKRNKRYALCLSLYLFLTFSSAFICAAATAAGHQRQIVGWEGAG